MKKVPGYSDSIRGITISMWFVVILSFMPMMSGCRAPGEICHDTCYQSITVHTEPSGGPVEIYEYASDLERVGKEQFSDGLVIGKSYFTGPYIEARKLKRFAARIGANVVLCQRNLERAGLDVECHCNPVEAADPTDKEIHDPNMITFASASVSVSGSAASGPGATYIFSHKIWFLYRDSDD